MLAAARRRSRCASAAACVSLTDRLEDTQFTVEELKAAVAEADARDTYVTADAHNCPWHSQRSRSRASSASSTASFLDEETAEAMAKAGAYLVPTFAVVRLFAEKAKDWGIPDEMLPRMNGVEEAMTQSLRLPVPPAW